jgi:hypothetical protein
MPLEKTFIKILKRYTKILGSTSRVSSKRKNRWKVQGAKPQSKTLPVNSWKSQNVKLDFRKVLLTMFFHWTILQSLLWKRKKADLPKPWFYILILIIILFKQKYFDFLKQNILTFKSIRELGCQSAWSLHSLAVEANFKELILWDSSETDGDMFTNMMALLPFWR